MNAPPIPAADWLPRLRANAEAIRSALDGAARASGRDPAAVTLVAATKTVDAAVIARLPEVGVRDVGENRVQEAESKVRALSDLGLRWHMIGRLQTNKVRRALDLFHRVHAVDRDGLMDALAAEAARRGRTADCLLQVNVSGEESKAGYALSAVPEALRRARSLPSLRVGGFMAIPAPGSGRAPFRLLRELRDGLRQGPADLPDLSMGMSADAALAVEEGATLVRVGTALFEGLPPSLFGRPAAGDDPAGRAA